MTRFDEMLRRGLMDANLAQYETVLRHANDMQPDFSPYYLRERTRMLADPWEWGRRRSVRRRIDWRLIAIVAALLLLSACAYAVVTGQFSQWFPRLGVDPAAPEVSEDVLSRTGTVIEQSQTVGDTTVTLNAAVWDGNCVYLSLVIDCPNIPEELTPGSPLAYSLFTEDCSLKLREDQWKTYVRENWTHMYAESGQSPGPELEADIQAQLDEGQWGFFGFLNILEREGNTLTCMPDCWLDNFVDRPELTLHLENIALGTFGEDGHAVRPAPGEAFIQGPFDLTFTLERPILPIRYGGADVEVMMGDIPIRYKAFEFSATTMTVTDEVLVPVVLPGPDENPDNADKLTISDVNDAYLWAPWGIWTADGKYVDLSSAGGSGGGGENPEGVFEIDLGHDYPYPVDPATVTAVNVCGVRVELSGLEVVPVE